MSSAERQAALELLEASDQVVAAWLRKAVSGDVSRLMLQLQSRTQILRLLIEQQGGDDA